MARISLETTINAPAERVFDAISDFANTARLIKGITRIEMLTDGPTRVGTRFRESRIMFGKEATEVFEVVGFEPPRQYTLRAMSCGFEVNATMRCAPANGSTRLALDMISRPVTFMARLMSPLGALMNGQMRKAMDKDLQDIKTSLESADA